MDMKFKIALAAFISFFFLLVSCQKDRVEVLEDPLDENYKLIDRGEYTVAIDRLQELSFRDPRPQVRVALASAYAARAGIRVGQYWGFVIGFKAPLVTLESLPMNSSVESLKKIAQQLNGHLEPQDLEVLGEVINALVLWERYRDRLEAIPVVEGSALRDAQMAVEILSPVTTPGARLYRAILNLILFKSHFSASAAVWKDFNFLLAQLGSGKLEVLCELQAEELLIALRSVSFHLMETLSDLSGAFQNEKKNLLEARKVVQSFHSLSLNSFSELKKKKVCP